MNLKISYKKLSVVVLMILIFISIGMIYLARDIRSVLRVRFILGPQLYPVLLGSGLLLFCLKLIIDTIKKPDEIIEIRRAHRILVVLGLILAWVLCWQNFGNFYKFAFVFTGIMLYYLNPDTTLSAKKILIGTLLPNIIIVGGCYLLFGIALRIPM